MEGFLQSPPGLVALHYQSFNHQVVIPALLLGIKKQHLKTLGDDRRAEPSKFYVTLRSKVQAYHLLVFSLCFL